MKHISLSIVAGALLLAFVAPAFAAGKEITLSGEAKCAKCALKQGDKCQTVIQTEAKDGKKVTYYLVANDVAKGFHDNVCSEAKKVKATGTVAKVDGKQELTATKIELVN